MPRDPRDENATRQERAQYAQWWTAAESLAYYKFMQERFKVEIKVSKPNASLASAEAGSNQAGAK
jgi:peptidyl-prolyl cis-trans isomerase D